jgi:hypothetical protein
MPDQKSRLNPQLFYNHGVIAPGELYTREEVQRRLGFEDAALRSARRNGLCCHRKHGRAFYLGADVIAYLTSGEHAAGAVEQR